MSNKVSAGNGIKKQEEGDMLDSSIKDEKRDVKPNKTLNRVPRACNACRKQKMRCEGADNPPCRRCRHAGLECLFEKPSREPTLTGEAGLERFRSLEARVADIQSTLAELVHYVRSDRASAPPPSSSFPPSFRQSPTMYPTASPSISTSSTSGPVPVEVLHGMHSSSAGPSDMGIANPFAAGQGPLPPMISPTQLRQQRGVGPVMTYRNPSTSGSGQRPMGDIHGSQLPQHGAFPQMSHIYSQGSGNQGPTLPPISSIQDMGQPRPGPSNVSSLRYHPGEMISSSRPLGKHPSSTHPSPGRRSPKRKPPNSSNVTSSNTSDVEEDDNGELPASGLVAPWEVLRGLADVAIERAALENGESSEPHSRARSSSPDANQTKPSKRRKTHHRDAQRALTFTDVISKKIISEVEARELFKIFYAGCSTFLPVFDLNYDTYESLHERSPFALDCICMVAAKVRDGGGPPSETYLKCLEEVRTISCATLFAPVSRQEAVQAMILVSGWSDNGWLSGGHAVRMAVELSMHKAWPRLKKRIEAGKASQSAEDRKMITAARIWFCLYLFEHQMSYGTGRPAILKDDESIWGSRRLLEHPLAIQDDMRLCSTLELMAIRERIHNKLSPVDGPVDEQTFAVIRQAEREFQIWFKTWDNAFSQKYGDAAFYRQSLQIQQLLAELFHNATALRGIEGLEDVRSMPPAQKDLALESLSIAQRALSICVGSTSYREGLKYAVHYTHVTATFTASFLLRLARLFPEHCDMQAVRSLVERLVSVLSEIPARRYAFTLQLMLKKSKKRTSGASHSPIVARQPPPPSVAVEMPPSLPLMNHPVQQEISSPTYDRSYSQQEMLQNAMVMHVPAHFNADAANLDQIWRGFEGTANEQLPVWLSDQSLGGNSLSQLGLEAFMMPAELDYQRNYAPQIW